MVRKIYVVGLIYQGDYCYLHGFAFEGGDEPIQTDSRLFDVNVKERADFFASEIEYLSQIYATDQILIFMGCDFQFMVCFRDSPMLIYLERYQKLQGEHCFLILY